MHVETHLKVDLSSSAQVKIQVKFNFELKKIKFFGSHVVASIREALFVDVSITYVGLILTKLRWYLFSAFGNSGYGQNSISNFLKNFHIFGFPWCSTREDLSIDVLIINVGLILTKLLKFQLFVKIRISTFFEKKNQIFGFPWFSIRENLSIDASITNVGLISTKLWWFLFSAFGNSGYGQNSILSISNFLKNFHIFGFPWCSTREDLSIDVLITNVGLILTKQRWFQLFVKSQNSNFDL